MNHRNQLCCFMLRAMIPRSLAKIETTVPYLHDVVEVTELSGSAPQPDCFLWAERGSFRIGLCDRNRLDFLRAQKLGFEWETLYYVEIKQWREVICGRDSSYCFGR
jgi:hypothetical protein